MADVFSRAKRSAVMSSIRARGNRDTELRLVTLMRAHGISGWRRGQPLFGKPDFIFRVERVAVFVDGCFWHGCTRPSHAPIPKTRRTWWLKKLAKNRDRDRLVSRTLRRLGWRVVRIWECELRLENDQRVLGILTRALAKSRRRR